MIHYLLSLSRNYGSISLKKDLFKWQIQLKTNCDDMNQMNRSEDLFKVISTNLLLFLASSLWFLISLFQMQLFAWRQCNPIEIEFFKYTNESGETTTTPKMQTLGNELALKPIKYLDGFQDFGIQVFKQLFSILFSL